MLETALQDRYRNIIRVPPDTRQRFVNLDQEAAVPLVQLGVRLSGIGTFGLDYQVGYRDPNCHLLLFTIAGGGTFHSDSGELQPQPGEVLLSPVGIPMHLGTTDQSWTFLWFYIHRSRRWKHLDGQPPKLTKPSYAHRLIQSVEGLLAESGWLLTQSVLSEAGWKAEQPQAIIPSSRIAILYGELIAEYLIQTLAAPLPASDPWEGAVRKLCHAIEQSPELPWSQEDMCRMLAVSPATLQRQFRRVLDSSPRQVLIALRMRHARRLLSQSDYPLAVIAREVGYADAFCFSAAFKNFHGASPEAFRQTGIVAERREPSGNARSEGSRPSA